MYSVIIKFSERTNYLNILFFAVATGLLSVLLQTSPGLQFLIMASAVLLEIVVFQSFELLQDKRFNSKFIAFQALKIFLSGLTVSNNLLFILLILAAFSIAILLLSEFKGYFLAVSGQLADYVSTKYALGSLGEANPAMRGLMRLLGENLALGLMKFGLMGSIILYSWLKLEDLEEIFVLKSIAFLGFAMAARNLILLGGL